MTPCLLQCKMQSEKCKIQNDGMNGFTFDALVRSPQCCHCEERSDAAISFFQTVTNYEIASLRSQRRLLELFTNESHFSFCILHFPSISSTNSRIVLCT